MNGCNVVHVYSVCFMQVLVLFSLFRMFVMSFMCIVFVVCMFCVLCMFAMSFMCIVYI